MFIKGGTGCGKWGGRSMKTYFGIREESGRNYQKGREESSNLTGKKKLQATKISTCTETRSLLSTSKKEKLKGKDPLYPQLRGKRTS